jgi:hypothetical protein
MSISTLGILNMAELIDAGPLVLEKGHKIAGKSGPITAEHLRVSHLDQDAHKAETSQKEQEASLPLQPSQPPVVPFAGFDPDQAFPLVMNIVSPFMPATS